MTNVEDTVARMQADAEEIIATLGRIGELTALTPAGYDARTVEAVLAIVKREGDAPQRWSSDRAMCRIIGKKITAELGGAQ